MEKGLKTVDVLRRNYGRRYTGLPVDNLERDSFSIDCSESCLRPDMFDLQIGDTVRWVYNGRYLEGQIAQIERNGVVLTVRLTDVALLPSDFFPY
jgi:hypothetical protein